MGTRGRPCHHATVYDMAARLSTKNALLALGVVAVTAAALRKGKKRKRTVAGGLGGYPYPRPRIVPGDVPHAQGIGVPAFPIADSSKHQRRLDVSYKDVNGKWHNRMSRSFHAIRAEGARWHAGIDLFGNPGDVIVAPEAGRIINVQNFLNTIDGAGPDAMLIDTDPGLMVLLGEIDEEAFGLKVGDRVERGQPVAKIQQTTKGSHMLHIETYRTGVTKNQRWLKGKPAPSHLLDPTDYLLRAKAAAEGIA